MFLINYNLNKIYFITFAFKYFICEAIIKNVYDAK